MATYTNNEYIKNNIDCYDRNNNLIINTTCEQRLYKCNKIQNLFLNKNLCIK